MKQVRIFSIAISVLAALSIALWVLWSKSASSPPRIKQPHRPDVRIDGNIGVRGSHGKVSDHETRLIESGHYAILQENVYIYIGDQVEFISLSEKNRFNTLLGEGAQYRKISLMPVDEAGQRMVSQAAKMLDVSEMFYISSMMELDDEKYLMMESRLINEIDRTPISELHAPLYYSNGFLLVRCARWVGVRN